MEDPSVSFILPIRLMEEATIASIPVPKSPSLQEKFLGIT
jgi:hypothetical protein